MPYIKPEQRKKYEPHLSKLREIIQADIEKGELTYLVYCLALEFWKKKGRNYTNISTSISSLIDAAEEMRRRHLFPYEDEKIKENTDVE